MRWLACLIFVTSGAVLGAEQPVRSLREIRQEKVVVQQWDTSCGAAALATLLRYQHGRAVSEKQVAEARRVLAPRSEALRRRKVSAT